VDVLRPLAAVAVGIWAAWMLCVLAAGAVAAVRDRGDGEQHPPHSGGGAARSVSATPRPLRDGAAAE
jgi:hypothetical protein